MMKIDSARISFMRICRDLFYNLYEKLKDADCINLQEHSSFTQALNLKLDDKLISILNEDKVLAPYSLTLPIDFFTKYSPHNHLFFKKGKNDSVVLFLPKNLALFIVLPSINDLASIPIDLPFKSITSTSFSGS